jgi:hypothetical protein
MPVDGVSRNLDYYFTSSLNNIYIPQLFSFNEWGGPSGTVLREGLVDNLSFQDRAGEVKVYLPSNIAQVAEKSLGLYFNLTITECYAALTDAPADLDTNNIE